MSTQRRPLHLLAALVVTLVVATIADTADAQRRRRSTRSLVQPSFAQVDEDDPGRDHFLAGVDLYRNDDRDGAVEEFIASFDARPEPVVAYNLGQVLRELRRYEEAVVWYRRFLELGEGRAARRRQVATVVRRLERILVPLSLDVRPDQAEVRIDGRVVGRAPFEAPVLVGPGERRLTITAEGFVPIEDMVLVRARQPVELAFSLVPTTSRLRVTADPPSATILIDGVPVGEGEAQRTVEQGRYVVEVVRPGYERRMAPIEVADDVELHLTLDPEPKRAWQKWWVWTIIAVAVVGLAVGTTAIVLAASSRPEAS
ncbi:MAG: PEGA domain-containing protein [Myxococcales bacterium]|nr:PEGA domain-containing protein [Myxococcales bacterium]